MQDAMLALIYNQPTVYKKADMDITRWNKLQAVASIILSSIIQLPLSKCAMIEATDQCALLKFEPLQNNDPVLPILTIPTNEKYKAAMMDLVDLFLRDSWLLDRRNRYVSLLNIINEIMNNLPEKLSKENRSWVHFHLMNALAWNGNPKNAT